MQNTGVDESIPGNAAIQSTMELLDRDPILASNTRPEISADKRSPFFFYRYVFLLTSVDGAGGVSKGVARRSMSSGVLRGFSCPLDNNYLIFALLLDYNFRD